MKTKYNILIFFSCLLFYASNTYSQATHCGSFYFESQMNSTDANYSVRAAAFETALQDSIISQHTDSLFARVSNVTFGTTRIAVVFHVIGSNTANYVNSFAIQQAINDLNDLFRNTGTNANNNTVDTEIEFCLAIKDPNGLTTSGINFISDGSHGAYGPYSTSDANDIDIKTPSHWDNTKYLNIWIADLGNATEKVWGSGPTLYLPVAAKKFRDGVVIDMNNFNTKLLAHGIGHWLNLRHTYGDDGSTCGTLQDPNHLTNPYNTDYCSDTPWCTGSASGWACNTLTDQCPANNTPPNNNRQIENYMDDSDEGCKNMFTLRQKNRMQALFSAGRTGLQANSVAVCVVQPTCNDNIQNGQETGVDCGGPTCAPCPMCPPTVYFTINGRSTNWSDIVNVCNYYGAIMLNPVSLNCPYSDIIWDYKVVSSNSSISSAVNGEGELSGYNSGAFGYLFISIQQCDMDKNPIGQESGAWFNISPYIHTNLNLHHFISYLSVPLAAGNYYRILVQGAHGPHIAYIKVVEPNVTLSNRTITNSQVGDNISLNACTIASAINVVATNVIEVLPNSSLTSGNYFINTITCNNTSTFRQSGSNNSGNYNLETENNAISKNNSKINTAKLDDKISIIPNPNNGTFTIATDENSGVLKSVEIQNSLGIVVQTITQFTSSTEINIQNQPAGLYLVKLNFADRTITKKMIKN